MSLAVVLGIVSLRVTYCVLCLTMHFLGVSLLFKMASEKRLQYRQVLLPLVSRQVIFSTVLSLRIGKFCSHGCSGHFAFRVSHCLSTCRAQGVRSTCGQFHRMLIRCSAVLEEVLAKALGLSPGDLVRFAGCCDAANCADACRLRSTTYSGTEPSSRTVAA